MKNVTAQTVSFEELPHWMNVSRETFEQLQAYVAQLIKWQEKINLISDSTIPEIWSRHIWDSAQLSIYISDKNQTITDVGAGAGLPGLVLAIMGYQHVTLIESDQRKVAFLREAGRGVKVPVTIHPDRAEALKNRHFDVIISRACASLETLFQLCEPWLKENSFCLFPKGKNYLIELEAAQIKWDFVIKIHDSLCDPAGKVLQISHLKRKDYA